MSETPAAIVQAREQFLGMVAVIRPELHRYCARLTGSSTEGEDIVQETLANALYALSQELEVPNLRPWLFRIAHNRALDYLKSHGRKHTEARADLEEAAGYEDRPDPAIVRAALAQFLALPVSQRSAVILKDVLGHSLEETADTMGTTVPAVKAALVRGRARLVQGGLAAAESRHGAREEAALSDLRRYAALFNARDWEGVRALIGDDCRLDLVSKAQRRGKEVRMYFDRYAKEELSLRVIRLEGRPALAGYAREARTPAYFIELEWDGGRVKHITDYRYVPYIVAEAAYEEIA